MLFNSFEFLLFFPVVVMLYFALPNKWRWLHLLISSYFFYGCWNLTYLSLIITSTIVTYYSAVLIGKTNSNEALDEKQKRKQKRLWVALCIIINIGILGFFKYSNFAVDTFATIFSFSADPLDILLPVGISFYTFQALSYTLDIYNEKIEAEKNIFKYALFVSFFPQLVAGPIEKANHLLPQIHTKKEFNYNRVRSGLILMAWGFFKKLVIADRLGLFVNEVHKNLAVADPVTLTFSVIFFTFQLYLDFSAYSDIAIGAARIMGFNLSDNFKRPYMSASFSEFWKRWHISLSSWFMEYLYFPLGGNRRGAGRKVFNLLVVFMISGLWHGASWNFVIWGAINGMFLIALDPLLRTKKEIGYMRRVFSGFFIMVCWGVSLIFFRAKTFDNAMHIFSKMGFSGSEKLYEFGLNASEFTFAIYLLIGFYIYELIREKKHLLPIIMKRPLPVRWLMYFIIVMATILLGSYGLGSDDNSFIYFQF